MIKLISEIITYIKNANNKEENLRNDKGIKKCKET